MADKRINITFGWFIHANGKITVSKVSHLLIMGGGTVCLADEHHEGTCEEIEKSISEMKSLYGEPLYETGVIEDTEGNIRKHRSASWAIFLSEG